MPDEHTSEAGSVLDDWPEGQVNRVARTWQDNEGEWWIAVFDLANLRGRVECVGVALASYQLHEDEDARREGFYPWPSGAHLEDVSLRPLSATTLRQLPFDAVLRIARRDRAALLRTMAKFNRPYVGRSYPDMKVEVNPEFTEARAGVIEGTGRRSKYGPDYLARVARLYQAAFEDRMDPPAKRVQDALNVSPDVARKLIQRCRKTNPPLLPPTERRKARGWLPGERGEKP